MKTLRILIHLNFLPIIKQVYAYTNGPYNWAVPWNKKYKNGTRWTKPERIRVLLRKFKPGSRMINAKIKFVIEFFFLGLKYLLKLID